ncbi:MAG: chromosome segregation protein SMC [Betaproteobacteria bacterium]|nr:chromosome segregation protein SMC [Betaproteobacteria bacterium]
MRLAHIKLAGFKSFVEQTIIPVSGDLVGVVGPNGCGKSNIIDAVRWVLGESKASALRGDSMQDVIFGGSANRKPMNRASVELIFDNSAGKVVGQWSSYTDISIKRVLQRDGISNYYINNIHVRRRDIADIFLGTGVGGRGYAIIEQGMISRIIEAKPQELRIFLEEAAGISKYRERRYETASRLTDTRKNLTRLEDIHQELETQRQHLEAQAEIANQFKALDAQLQTTQHVLWLQHKQEATNQRLTAENEIRQLENDLEKETTHLRDTGHQLEEARTQENNNREYLHEVQGQLYAANAETGRIEQEIQHIHTNNERLTQQLLDVEKQLNHNEQQAKILADHFTHWHNEIAQANSTHESSIQSNKIENEKLPEIETNFIKCQEALNTSQRNLMLTEQACQLEESNVTHANKTLQQLNVRNDRLQLEQSTLSQPDHEALANIQQELEETEIKLAQNKQTSEQNEERLSQINQLKEQATNQAQLTQQTLTQLNARFNALSTLQQKIENNNALSTWLTKYQYDTLPRLWQNIQVDGVWENAMEAILRERLNSIGFLQLEIIQEWIDDLPPGRWAIYEFPKKSETFAKEIQQQKVATDTNHPNRKSLLEYLTCIEPGIKQILEEWLSHVFVIDTLQDGILLRDQLNHGELLVTREGHIFSRNGLTFYTPDSQLHGVLSRQQELEHIRIEIAQTKKTLNKQQAKLNSTQHQYDELNHATYLHRQNHQQLLQQRHQYQLDKLKLTQANEQIIQRRDEIYIEVKEIKQQLEAEIVLKKSAEMKLAQNRTQAKEINQQIQQAQLSWKAADQELIKQRQLVQQATQTLQEAAFNVKTCQSKISETENAINALGQEKDRLVEKQKELFVEQENLDETPLKNQLQASLTQRKSLEQTVSDARNNLEEVALHLREIDQTRMACEQKSLHLREAINQIRLKEQAAILTEQRFDEQLDSANADKNALFPLIGKKSTTTLQTEINRLNTKITSLGAVNLAALEELAAVQAREINLDSQLQDLNEAIQTLENAIEQIDHETQTRLQKTFDAVNHNLNDIFPVIFAGGQARLVLSDGKILDSGLVLTAQPPGKKNSSIHLLSGGEKALTALALIFSLFRLNPAPFCLLDEVDAPLDDSNTERFCDLVKNMSIQTQFLFISHNKITMEMAQQLIGITMQEQGVSRVVAVDIAEAIKLGVSDSQEIH